MVDAAAPAERSAAPLSGLRLAGFLIAAALVGAGFIALGTWQVHRLAWKLDLIERVEQRVHAAPVAPPPRARWMQVNAADDEYRRVCVDGSYHDDHAALVQAVTTLGPGHWLLTPLQTDSGDFILINRGYIAAGQGAPPARAQAAARARVCGLLRLTEPGGGFLRRNDPAQARWYSRDVAAIAAAQGLPAPAVAPYFIDADADSSAPGGPVGGLTVIRFHNSHLVYAITWYALALMTLGGAVIVLRHARRRRQGAV